MSWNIDISKLSFSGKLLKNITLSSLSYINIGGKVDLLAYPNNKADLVQILRFSRQNSIPVYVLGNSSNVLFSDKGLSGIVISMKNFKNKISFQDNLLTLRGDMRLEKFIKICAKKKMGGTEFLVGIPACVMPSIFCNTGVANLSICDILSKIRYIDDAGNDHTLSRESFDVSYRSGPLKHFAVIYEATFQLFFQDPVFIQKKIERFWNYRKKTQPLDAFSLGCVFKNPDQKTSAGQIIDSLGFKGRSIGGISVSQKHANFFLNTGRGTASDFLKLLKEVRSTVEKKTGIFLDLEIKTLGQHS